MRIKNWMSQNVIVVDENESMINATKILKKNNIRMLPVLKKDKLIGVITDSDLKKASASDATALEIHELLYLLSKIKVKNILTEKPITVHPDFTLGECAEILLENKISGAPVVEGEDNVVGVITQIDIYKALISLTGVSKKGIHFAVKVEDRPGSIREVTDIVRKYGGRLVSILTSYDNVEESFRKVFIRMYGIDDKVLKNLLDDISYAVELLYFVDHRKNLSHHELSDRRC